MQALTAPLYELAEYSDMKRALRKGNGIVSVAGCVDAQKWHMAYGLGDDYKYKIIATFNELHVKEISEQFRAYDRNTLVYRIEKIQKSTGLDLRSFDDALTFKIALMVVNYMKYLEDTDV